jgi:ATP phosphoribosyltransferase regulatory subunit
MPGLTKAVDRFAARHDALRDAGLDPATCPSRRASGARRWNTTTASSSASSRPSRPDLPPVATGGRYDALTAILGAEAIPAVGGVIRPELVRDLRAGGAP